MTRQLTPKLKSGSWPAWRTLLVLAAALFAATAATLRPAAADSSTFSNNTAVLINDNAAADPFPSTINVSGISETVSGVRVSLQGLSHSFPDDVDVLLVGPGGQSVLLMSDAGGDFALSGATLHFENGAPALPDAAQIVTGQTYGPTDYAPADFFEAPAPAQPYGSSLAVFNARDPNGAWNLYVLDDNDLDEGSLDGGWSLSIETGVGQVQFSSVIYNASEGGGVIEVVVTRAGNASSPLTVDFATADGTARAGEDYTSTAGTLSFAAGQSSRTISIPLLNDATTEGAETFRLMLSNPSGSTVLATPSAADVIIEDDDFRLFLAISPGLVDEATGTGAATGTLQREGPLGVPLDVSLASGDPSEATVPALVTIPAGAATATFLINTVDDSIADGPQRVGFSARASGYPTTSAGLTVTDNEARLTISIRPGIFSETAGANAATGTIRRNTDPTNALTLKLLSGDTSEVTIPTFVTIAAGASSATFAVNAIDDNIADGPLRVGISARVKGYSTVSTGVTVTDNEAALSLSISPNTFGEGGGANAATGTVTRNTPTNVLLKVTLTNSDLTEARVPNSVTIPVGAASATFPITAIDDAIVDGSRRLTIRAAASSLGFTSGTAIVTVTDND